MNALFGKVAEHLLRSSWCVTAGEERVVRPFPVEYRHSTVVAARTTGNQAPVRQCAMYLPGRCVTMFLERAGTFRSGIFVDRGPGVRLMRTRWPQIHNAEGWTTTRE